MQTVSYTYDDSQSVNPLVYEILPVFSYADGAPFDKIKSYLLGATKLAGECLFLKQSSSYSVVDSKCNKMKAFICQWNSKFPFSFYKLPFVSTIWWQKQEKIIL